MSDTVNVVDFYIAIIQKFGIAAGIFSLLFVLSLAFLIWLVNHLGNINIEKYKTDVQSFSDLILRNENLRQELLSETIRKGNSIRLEIFDRTYSIFFTILHNQNTLKEDDELYGSISKEIQSLREDIFKKSIYLAGIFGLLLETQIALSDAVDYAKTNQLFENYTTKHQFPLSNASNNLGEIAKWISQNMKTSQTLNEVDLSESDIKKIKEAQTNLINDKR